MGPTVAVSGVVTIAVSGSPTGAVSGDRPER